MRLPCCIFLSGVLLPGIVHAADAESVRVTVDAPDDCLTADDLPTQLEVLGARMRPAAEGERARRFVVAIEPSDGRFVARLVVEDLVGRRTMRTVERATCEEAARAVSLLVSLALDEPPPESRRDPELPTRYQLPALTSGETVPEPQRPRGRVGSGALVATATWGFVNGPAGPDVDGANGYAMWRAFGTTRMGVSLGVQRTAGDLYVSNSPNSFVWMTDGRVIEGDIRETNGLEGHVGWSIGWGAPFNDSVAGFLADVGVAGGRDAFARQHTEVRAVERRWLSPYIGWRLVLQVPWRAPIRPVAILGSAWRPLTADNSSLTLSGELGLAWQAW
jgi:hypothetical protein